MSHIELNPIRLKPSHPSQNGDRYDPPEYDENDENDKDEPSENDESDEDEEDLVMEDVSRALLTPGTSRFPTSRDTSRPGLWAQVKGIVVESAPTLLFMTLGLLFTGEMLDHVSRWQAMSQVDQLIMIVPVVLNLKGNLEMNLSARLGTAANVGDLDDKKTRRALIVGNLTLLQVQATAVSFIAAGVSLILGRILPRTTPAPPELASRAVRPLPPPQPDVPRKSGLPTFLYVAASAVAATCASGLLLGSFMCTLVILCRRFGLDPDNIAPAIASCLGDLVTLILLAASASALLYTLHTPIPSVLLVLLTLSAISCIIYTRRNRLVAPLLFQGWSPLLVAMVISSCTGIILDLFVSRYAGFALLAVVISGLPGGVGAIFISRLSTSLHAAKLSAESDPTSKPPPAQPSERVVMLTLLFITIPVEVIFLALLTGFGWLQLQITFAFFALLFFGIAVVASLLIGRLLVRFLWARGLDPDICCLWCALRLCRCWEAMCAYGRPRRRLLGSFDFGHISSVHHVDLSMPPGAADEDVDKQADVARLRHLLHLNRVQKQDIDVRLNNHVEQEKPFDDVVSLKQIQAIYQSRIVELRRDLGTLGDDDRSDAERDIYELASIPDDELWTQPAVTSAKIKTRHQMQATHGDLLKTVFGHKRFHTAQALAIDHTLNGKDVVLIQPTGHGKSLAFQLPAVVEGKLHPAKVTIVISPLLSLIQDQVAACTARGIEAISITSLPTNMFKSPADLRAELDSDRRPVLIYVTPERINTASGWFYDFLCEMHARRELGRFAIDEGHCIVQWGPTFRESYLRLEILRPKFPTVPIIVLTSTLTPPALDSTTKLLRLVDPVHKRSAGTLRHLVEWIRTNHRHHSGIIFRTKKSGCERLAKKLCEEGITAVFYHGECKDEAAVRSWMEGTAKVMIATAAFGMGIDKRDVRFIVHYDCPSSIESYYQEIGRGGRDGKETDCLLFYRYTDLFIALHPGTLILRNDMQVIAQKRSALAMAKFAESITSCAVLSLLRYFDEDFPSRCGTCSNCLHIDAAKLVTKDFARLAKDAVALMRGLLRAHPGERVTVGHLASLLLGHKLPWVNGRGRKEHEQYGAAARGGVSPDLVDILVGRLLGSGALEVERLQNGAHHDKNWYLKMGPKADSFKFLATDGTFKISFFHSSTLRLGIPNSAHKSRKVSRVHAAALQREFLAATAVKDTDDDDDDDSDVVIISSHVPPPPSPPRPKGIWTRSARRARRAKTPGVVFLNSDGEEIPNNISRRRQYDSNASIIEVSDSSDENTSPNRARINLNESRQTSAEVVIVEDDNRRRRASSRSSRAGSVSAHRYDVPDAGAQKDNESDWMSSMVVRLNNKRRRPPTPRSSADEGKSQDEENYASVPDVPSTPFVDSTRNSDHNSTDGAGSSEAGCSDKDSSQSSEEEEEDIDETASTIQHRRRRLPSPSPIPSLINTPTTRAMDLMDDKCDDELYPLPIPPFSTAADEKYGDDMDVFHLFTSDEEQNPIMETPVRRRLTRPRPDNKRPDSDSPDSLRPAQRRRLDGPSLINAGSRRNATPGPSN
ncbi:Mg transporter [Mycena kentingensis (nom. inval.)]|nr:Mg transporter [Mycena kentingensis (nom. inval.)]